MFVLKEEIEKPNFIAPNLYSASLFIGKEVRV